MFESNGKESSLAQINIPVNKKKLTLSLINDKFNILIKSRITEACLGF